MSDGQAALEAFIAGVEALQTLNEDVAKAAEAPVADAVRATASNGTSPDGKPWASSSDGGKALEGAAGAIKSAVKGTRITLTIGAPYVFHNHGAGGSSTSKGAVAARDKAKRAHSAAGTSSKFHAPKRQILPDAGEPIPKTINAAIKAVAERVFKKAVG